MEVSVRRGLYWVRREIGLSIDQHLVRSYSDSTAPKHDLSQSCQQALPPRAFAKRRPTELAPSRLSRLGKLRSGIYGRTLLKTSLWRGKPLE